MGDGFPRGAFFQFFAAFVLLRIIVLAAADFDGDLPFVLVVDFFDFDIFGLDLRTSSFHLSGVASSWSVGNWDYARRRKAVVRLTSLMEFGVALAGSSTTFSNFCFFAFAVPRMDSKFCNENKSSRRTQKNLPDQVPLKRVIRGVDELKQSAPLKLLILLQNAHL